MIGAGTGQEELFPMRQEIQESLELYINYFKKKDRDTGAGRLEACESGAPSVRAAVNLTTSEVSYELDEPLL